MCWCSRLVLLLPLLLQSPRPGSPEFEALYGAAGEGQAEGARAAALRRAYQRALCVPTPQLESLWRGYEAFEGAGSNKTLGKRELDEWRPRYQVGLAWMRPAAGLAAQWLSGGWVVQGWMSGGATGRGGRGTAVAGRQVVVEQWFGELLGVQTAMWHPAGGIPAATSPSS